jgi:hypothetical protein
MAFSRNSDGSEMNRELFRQLRRPLVQIPMKQSPCQSVETNEDDVSPRRNTREFFRPTANELACLLHKIPGARAFTRTDERENRFARLLNRGSSLE